MKQHRGISTAELGMILALVILAAIPALMFLGNTVNNGLTDSADLSRADNLFAIMDAKTSDPYAGGASIAVTTGPTYSSESGSGTVPDFGNGFTTGTLGSMTTSANGTSLAADALDYLANGGSLTTPMGTTSLSSFFGSDWGTIDGLLSDMANIGYDIAQNEQTFIDAGGPYGTTLNEIQGTLVPELSSKYRDLANFLTSQYGSDFATNGPAEVQALWATVNNSTGIISYGAKEFVTTGSTSGNYPVTQYNSNDFQKLTDNVVGTAFQSGDIYETPKTTASAADSLQ